MLKGIAHSVFFVFSVCVFVLLIIFLRAFSSRAQQRTLSVSVRLQGEHIASSSGVPALIRLYTTSGMVHEVVEGKLIQNTSQLFSTQLTLPPTLEATTPIAVYMKPVGHVGRLFCTGTIIGQGCTTPQIYLTADHTNFSATQAAILAGDTSPPDGVVNALDMSRIIADLGKIGKGPVSDVNTDGITNATDYALTLYSLSQSARDDYVPFSSGSATPIPTSPLSSPTPQTQPTPTPGGGAQTGQIVVYPVSNADTLFQGEVSANAQTVPLQFETVISNDRSKWKTTIARFATGGPVQVKITVPQQPVFSELRSPTQIMSSAINGNTVSFSLPAGSGVYTLKTNRNQPQLETIVLWVDDIARVAQTAPAGSIVIQPGANLQSAIGAAASGSTLYLSPGTHSAGSLLIENKQSLSIILHPEAILNQNSSDGIFIDVKNSDGVKILGPGKIITPDNNPKTVLILRNSRNIELGDFFLYKKHERDGWTLHVYQSQGVNVNYVRIISGNDGSDPDSSSNVVFNGMHIESQDDAVAVKTRGSLDVNGFTFKNGFAKSAASALKIGEATVKKRVDNVTFIDSTVFDTDRAMVVTPSCDESSHDGCDGSIGTVLYKNITVYNMQRYKMAKTIRVHVGGSYWRNTSITFDSINAEFIDTAITDNEVTVTNSTLKGMSAIRLFSPGVCPRFSGNKLEWAAGTGQLGCGSGP